jgi:hypothetical protein
MPTAAQPDPPEARVWLTETSKETGAVPPTATRRIGARVLHELREAVAPTLFFFVGFNLIVLTTNLLVAQYAVAVGSFMIATLSALIVGKAVLVANALPFLKTFDRAPLIQPILFKTSVYWVIVFLVRVLERFVRFTVAAGNPPAEFPSYLISNFSWDHFIAVSLWILVLFLIYVTASEFNQVFGHGEMWRLMFTSRPSELQLNRRQRAREFLRLGRLVDLHSADEFADTTSLGHQELMHILRRLAKAPSPKA